MSSFPLSGKTAEDLVRNFYHAFKVFERSLPADQKPVLFVIFGDDRIQIDRIQWLNPITVFCIRDAQSEQEPARVVVQHSDQFSVLMDSEKRVKEEEKRPGTVLGFGDSLS